MRSVLWTAIVLSVVLCPASLFAHGVGLEAKLKGDKVVVEGFFDDDTPADDAKVTVEDESGKVVLEGKTDAKGVWTFPPPKPGKYKIKLDAGAGHRATTTLHIPGSSTPTSETTEQTVSEGPSRAEFTRTPWDKIAIGLGAIGLGALLFWWRSRKNAATVLLLFGAFLPVACTKGEAKKTVCPVHGTILVDGHPANGAVVILHPTDDLNSDIRPRGLVQKDGGFKLSTYSQDDGAGAGSYKVTVEWRRQENHPEQGAELLPAYADPRLTKLTATINAGANEPRTFRLSRKN